MEDSMRRISAEDEPYLIAENEHIRRLRECDIHQLGLSIGGSSAGLSDWKTLAGLLNVSNSEVRWIEASELRLVPGEEVLKLWRRKEQSTIRILRQALSDMRRDDVVRQLDNFRLNMVRFTIVLMQDGQQNDVLRINCPGSKPLIDHVRPILTGKLHSRSNGIVLELDVRSTANVNWSSPAERFAGQQWTVTQKSLGPSATDRKSAPLIFHRKVEVERNAITDGDQLMLVFSQSPSEDTCSSFTAVQETRPPWPTADSSDVDHDTPPRYENVTTDVRQEVREARLLDGFHDIDPLSRHRDKAVEDLLSPYLREQGRYILRTSTSQPHVALAISVTHNQQICHYYIFSKPCKSGVLYCIHVEEGFRWDSLRGLLDHYRRHPIERCTGGDDLQLTAPVV